MENDPQTNEETTQEHDQTQVEQQTAVTPPATPPPAQQASPSNKRVISMPSDEVAKIRREERTKGAKARELELAKDLGFETIEEMKLAAKAGKGRKPDQPAPRGPKPVPANKVEKERKQFEDEKKSLIRKQSLAQKAAAIARRERDNAVVEGELRVAAVRAGVVDQDYALHLLRREMKGKSGKELEGFDELKFFTGLRTSHPHLFVVEERPVTTGNGGSTSDAAGVQPPKAGPAAKTEVDSKVTDAKKLTREQYEQRLASLGVANPTQGYSY